MFISQRYAFIVTLLLLRFYHNEREFQSIFGKPNEIIECYWFLTFFFEALKLMNLWRIKFSGL